MTTTNGKDFSLASSIVGQRRRFFRLIGGAAILLLIALCGSGVKASTTEVIYSLAGDDDGEYTDTDVEIDAAGNLYGTSVWAANSAVGPSGSCRRSVMAGCIRFSTVSPEARMAVSLTKELRSTPRVTSTGLR